MTPLRVKLAAHVGAPEDIINDGKKRFSKLLSPEKTEFADQDPDVIFFLTGGSERPVMQVVEKGGFYPMVTTDAANSNASALEVKAALAKQGIESVLLDADDKETIEFLELLFQVKNALASINGQQLGLIGEVSEWLVASDIKPEVLNSKLGVKLNRISWATLPDFQTMVTPDDFKSKFGKGNLQEVEKAGQVYSLLKSTIETSNLDGVTVECFSLVKEKAVSGCLALAMLNEIGIPAACEGDIVSATGMILSKAILGQIPWMANVAKIGYEKTLLAHCTIAPGLVSDFEIRTHFETGIGTAIQGDFIGDEFTMFRFDDSLENMFLAKGKVLSRPRYASACRTQVEVLLPEGAVDSLRENPLGNHHLILPGDHEKAFQLAGQLLNLTNVVN